LHEKQIKTINHIKTGEFKKHTKITEIKQYMPTSSY